jgi:hypothetical protein
MLDPAVVQLATGRATYASFSSVLGFLKLLDEPYSTNFVDFGLLPFYLQTDEFSPVHTASLNLD